MGADGSDQERWRDVEMKLRIREVASQRRMSWAQILVAVTALVGSLAAVSAVFQARNAVNVAEQGIQRQADENRLATAVTAIGGKTAAERVAGVTLLRRLVDERLMAAASAAPNSWDRWDAHSLYTSALVILANYLRGVPLATHAACPTRGHLDVQYVADELEQLLGMKAVVTALKVGSPPAIDLSYVELCGQYWPGVTFDWLPPKHSYLRGIDLRGADLYKSRWGTSDLSVANLQCANLSRADLSRANLTGADLRGANVSGAHLPERPELQAAQLDGVVGTATATGLPPNLSAAAPTATNWRQGACMLNSTAPPRPSAATARP